MRHRITCADRIGDDEREMIEREINIVELCDEDREPVWVGFGWIHPRNDGSWHLVRGL